MILDDPPRIVILYDQQEQAEGPLSDQRSLLFGAIGMYYGKTSDPFYRSPAWRRLRAVALERDHHICQDCLQQKRMGARIRARRAVVVQDRKSVV